MRHHEVTPVCSILHRRWDSSFAPVWWRVTPGPAVEPCVGAGENKLGHTQPTRDVIAHKTFSPCTGSGPGRMGLVKLIQRLTLCLLAPLLCPLRAVSYI